MTLAIETATNYGTDAFGPSGFNHNIISAAGANRMTLALFHSVSIDDAGFTNLSASGITPTFLATLSSLRAGLHHRLDVYYAGDSKTGAAGLHDIAFTAGSSQQHCEVAILTFVDVCQQVPTNYGNVASKVAKAAAPAWVGVQGSSGFGLSVRTADPSGTPLAGTTNNVCGFVPAANDAGTCQALLYLVSADLSNGLLVSAEY